MMGLQRTFILSLFLHAALSALLLLSVRLQGESGKMLKENVFYVDLKSAAYEPEVHRSLAIPKDTILKRPTVKKAREEERILKDSVSDKREDSLAESLSIVSGEVSDKTLPGETLEYTNSAQGGEEIISSAKTADDNIGRLSESDALKLISAAIERVKTYPAIARRRSMEGTVYVSFFIGAEGEPSEIKVIKGSGYKILDEATMKVIKKAAPYPYVDNRIEVPVTYRFSD
jgi:TonB family protein